MGKIAKCFRFLTKFVVIGTIVLLLLFILGYILQLPNSSLYAKILYPLSITIMLIDLSWVLFIMYLIKKEIYIEL